MDNQKGLGVLIGVVISIILFIALMPLLKEQIDNNIETNEDIQICYYFDISSEPAKWGCIEAEYGAIIDHYDLTDILDVEVSRLRGGAMAYNIGDYEITDYTMFYNIEDIEYSYYYEDDQYLAFEGSLYFTPKLKYTTHIFVHINDPIT